MLELTLQKDFGISITGNCQEFKLFYSRSGIGTVRRRRVSLDLHALA